jgi:beta-lactamase class A
MKIFCLLFLVSALFFACQSIHEKVTERLTNRFGQFEGAAGLYVERLDTGEKFSINADTLFPTASMIKVPILIALFQKIEEGALGYQDNLVWYADSINYPYGDGILYSFEDGREIPLSKVISLMITYSDNHASLWCQALAGGGETINAWLAEHGLEHTRVNSRTPGRNDDWQKYGWGQTTPKEMARMLIMIRNGEAVSPAASERMFRVLGNIYWDGEALSEIPPQIKTISKQGAVSESRSEVVLVNAPSFDYVFCIITNNQQDTGWAHENSGYVLIRDISRMLWKYFEPDYPWKPADGMEKYY